MQSVLILATLHYLGKNWREHASHCSSVALGERKQGFFTRSSRSAGSLVPALDEATKREVKVTLDDLSSKHHFTSGILLTLLEDGKRDSGYFPSSALLWTQPYDRRLWLLLNDHGRKTVIPETIAIRWHWQDELEAGRPLSEIYTAQIVEDMLAFEKEIA